MIGRSRLWSQPLTNYTTQLALTSPMTWSLRHHHINSNDSVIVVVAAAADDDNDDDDDDDDGVGVEGDDGERVDMHAVRTID